MGLLNLVGRISLDGGPFKQTLQGLKKEANSFGSVLSGQLTGLVGAGAMLGLVKSSIEAADKIDEVSERLGVSKLEAQQFALAAKLGGKDIDFFATKIEVMRKALRTAIDKGENPLDVFGMEATTDVFKALEGITKITSGGQMSGAQNQRFFDLIGKGAGNVINILNDVENAKTGTIFFSDEEIQKLKDADDRLTKLGNTAKVFAASLLSKNKNELADTMLGRLFGIKKTETKKPTTIDEDGIALRNAAKDAAATAHMATQERLLKIFKEIEDTDTQNRQNGMTDDEVRLELAKKREEIFNRIANTEEQRAQKELDLKLNEKSIIAVSKTKQLSPLKDSLTSVGNFIGMNPNSGQMKELSEMNRKLESIVRNTSRTGGSIFPQ